MYLTNDITSMSQVSRSSTKSTLVEDDRTTGAEDHDDSGNPFVDDESPASEVGSSRFAVIKFVYVTLNL